MNLPKTSFNETSHEKYVIDAAVLLQNLIHDGDEWKYDRVGATEGSVSIEVEMEYRQMEVNGASHLDVAEHAVLETFGATATASIKEITAQLIQQSINGKLEEDSNKVPEGYSVVKPKRTLGKGSFLKNIAFVGQLKGSQESFIAILDNAKVDEGLSGETEDGGEMAVEQVYRAHATVKQLVENIDYLPLTFIFPDRLVKDDNGEEQPAQMNIMTGDLEPYSLQDEEEKDGDK